MAFKFTDNNFKKEALESDKLVVVDFYADWCGPCKMIAPIIEELAESYKDTVKIGKLNVDDEVATAEMYRVMTIPTLLFIKDGNIVDSVVGMIPKTTLEAKIQALQ